ncbi:hypothetical protein H8788_14350 [Parabacteroides faecis]|uniref:hypothetical protein n=1 Tax=Parabacteroides TaxID=375288 RepID=UPI000EFF27EA|nr:MULTISPECIES: hypothetical protein [Parabacteroides]MBC8618923.1 hypothetical protein [Parabacteroides faecis]RHS00044.1 hypothetical protein DWW23_05225 [Parabacteroides sp. AF14-59]
MRLIELKEAIDKANNAFDFTTDNGNGIYYIKNLVKTKVAILDLYKVKFFTEEQRKTLSPIVNSMGTTITFTDHTAYTYLVSSLNHLKYTITQLYDWFQKFIPEPSEEDIQSTVNIKLPNIQGFRELETISKLLSGPFSAAVNLAEGGKIQIKQFDHGSFWIVLFVGSPIAVSLIAGIAWSAAVVSKKWKEVKIAEEMARRAQLQNDAIAKLVEYQEKEIKTLAEAEANALEQKCFTNNDKERVATIREAIRDVSELVIKGVQIQPALCAPENVANLFPDYYKLPFIDSKIKKLSGE